MNTLQSRIGFEGNLAPVLSKAFGNYELGVYKSHSVIEMGYEDLNLIVEANHKYFVKIFASFRDKKSCDRYAEIIRRARSAGVHQPEIYLTRDQKFLYETMVDDTPIRLIVMQYIDGMTLFDSPTKITGEEAIFLVREAAKINQIPIEPISIYDSWAIVNFLVEVEKKTQYLEDEDKELIYPLVEKFKQLDLKYLPHCFVHGDIIKTNVMRDRNNHLYILDFSVANFYPRIQEIAVLMCDIFFDIENLDLYKNVYDQTIQEYQKYVPLEKQELEALPLYCQVAHAMHVLGASYEKNLNNNTTKENEYFLHLGRVGLKFTKEYFKN